MKILHVADIHLSSKVRAGLKSISEDRKTATRASFKKIVEYAANEGIKVVILAGDVFDTTSPTKKDTEFFEGLVRKNPEIDFLYLRGNHDKASEDNVLPDIPNLKPFGDKLTSFEYGDVVVSGVDFTESNCDGVYSLMDFNKDKKNILVLHGTVGTVSGVESVNLKKLSGKNIDYLALGHIHAYSSGKLDERGTYAYSGCVEGKAFDEPGKKGFIVYDTDTLTHTFIPCYEREIKVIELNLSGVTSLVELLEKVGTADVESRDIVRLVLKGEVPTELEYSQEDIKGELRDRVFFLDVKDETIRKTDVSKYKNDASLRGEFVRSVFEDTTLTEEEKNEIVHNGLALLDGREVYV
ncbi:MAG: metallophosphoesterase [Lachnospiraceae bacterium]|nr:metallophosphoesterase [Lachnospiraceae bacterium]